MDMKPRLYKHNAFNGITIAKLIEIAKYISVKKENIQSNFYPEVNPQTSLTINLGCRLK